jgi:transcriptional regulator with XRE-family HTH domain
MTLNHWMIEHGMTDGALSKALGGIVSRSQLSRIRRGLSRPRKPVAQALEGVTGIPAARFVMGEAA